MASANINVRTDAALKAKAQHIYESIGLDLSTAVNLFLKQTVLVGNLPFVLGVSNTQLTAKTTAKRVSRYGVWKNKYALPADFDAPVDDFKAYM